LHRNRGKIKVMGEKYFNSEEYNLTEFLFIGELTLTIKKALIPAAGLGTRFLPATKSMPKEMLPIIDTPVIQYVVEEAICLRHRRYYYYYRQGQESN
jgi:UTP--glucose-1-phosphate uridylyltransferase